MFLYARVSEVVADSARKLLQDNRAIQLVGSATAKRAEQAKPPTSSARRHCTDRQTMLEALPSISHVNNLAIFYNATPVGSDHVLLGHFDSAPTPPACMSLKIRLIVNSNPVAPTNNFSCLVFSQLRAYPYFTFEPIA